MNRSAHGPRSLGFWIITVAAVVLVSSLAQSIAYATGCTNPSPCSHSKRLLWGSFDDELPPFSPIFFGGTQLSISTSDPNGYGIHAGFFNNFSAETGSRGGEVGNYELAFNPPNNTVYPAVEVTFSFDPPVDGLHFALLDLDAGWNGEWVDVVDVNAVGPGGPVATQVNGFGSFVEQLPDGRFRGTGPTDSQGSYTFKSRACVSFPDVVSSVTISYGTDPSAQTDPIEHYLWISDLRWCLAVVSVEQQTWSTVKGLYKN